MTTVIYQVLFIALKMAIVEKLTKKKFLKIEKSNYGSPTIEPIVEDLLGTIKKGDKA
ncbi:hypothetical protein AAUPMB_15400, partial [Pasteurella multocida subsp. multocida str. Anand1_buffalo]